MDVTATPVADQSTLPAMAPLPPPAQPYAVAKRELELSDGDRPLPTLVLFPAGLFVNRAYDVADGVFPLILFSHGLRGSPDLYEDQLRTVAAAGFIVVAPTYPGTSLDATHYDPLDVLNQPADASAVITAVLALAQNPADRLAGHVDPQRIGAVGHSAGGYTTVGLLTDGRDERIKAAVVLSGSFLRGTFHGPSTPVLFVHGDNDTVVPYDYGRTAYSQVPWPKAFLTVLGAGHADYLSAGAPAAAAVTATVLDFLRATLYGDTEALARIPGDAAVDKVTRFESTIAFPPAATPSAAPSPSGSATPSPTVSPTPSAMPTSNHP
jgi:predicted dienelactone hydrolase